MSLKRLTRRAHDAFRSKKAFAILLASDLRGTGAAGKRGRNPASGSLYNGLAQKSGEFLMKEKELKNAKETIYEGV